MDEVVELTPEEPAPERRRRSGTAARVTVLVAALVAGLTLGFALGRGSSGEPSRQSERARAESATGEDGDAAADVDVAAESAPAVGSGADGGAFATDPRTFDDTAAMSTAPGYGGTWWGSEPLVHLYTRDVGDAKVRVYRAGYEAYDDGVPWWDAPAYCNASGFAQADVSTPEAVGIATASTYSELPPGGPVGTLQIVGVGEGAPWNVAVVQAPPGTTVVRATFDDGGTDQMAPVDGIATLLARTTVPVEPPAEGAPAPRVRLTFVDGSGASTDAELRPYEEQEYLYPPECSPPPEPLPEPGPEQPADPEAARAAVTDVFARAYAGLDAEQRGEVIDDPSGLDTVLDELAAGPFVEQVERARAEVREIVFVSATRAAVRYDIVIEDSSTFGDRLGEAVLVDGAWKVTRATVCRDITLAGATCP